MSSKIYKISLGILTIIAFTIVVFRILGLLPAYHKDEALIFFRLNQLVLLLALLVMSALICAGMAGGLLFFIISVFLITDIASVTHFPYYNLNILLFIAAGIIANRFVNKTTLSCRMDDSQAEKTIENKNILTNQLKRNIDLTEALEKKIYRYAELEKTLEMLATNLSIDDIKRIVVEKSWNIIGKSDTCLLFLVDEEKQELALLASKVKDVSTRIKTKKGDIFDNWTLRHRLPLIVEDTTKDFRFDIKLKTEEKRNFKSLICAPLITHKRIIGTLRLDSDVANNYAPDDLRLLDIIADITSIIIYNAKLYQKTQELAITDAITGLYVRRYFQQRFDGELIRAKANNSSLSVLMLDIDHFKDYNDRYGHAAGDQVLAGIAKLIKKFTEQGDMVARYGGEEFIVLLPKKQKKEALRIAESMRDFISKRQFTLRRQPTNVTVSIGIAEFPQDALLKEDILEKADFCLYKAKKEGRNKVCYIES